MNFEDKLTPYLHPESYEHRKRAARMTGTARVSGFRGESEKMGKKKSPGSNEEYVYRSVDLSDSSVKHKPKTVSVPQNDLSRLYEHEDQKEANSNKIRRMSSDLVNNLFLQKSGASWEEIKNLKQEDKELLIDNLTSKPKNIESDNQMVWSELGWSKDDIGTLNPRDREYILNRNIRKNSYDEKVKEMVGLGYSLNQVFEVVPQDDREAIVQFKISPKEWINQSQKKYQGVEKISKKESPAYVKPQEKPKSDKILDLMSLGWPLKEANGVSKEKANFILENKIKKEDWYSWENEYNTIADSGSFAVVKPFKFKESVDADEKKHQKDSGEKKRHWPPENFTQKPGAINRWPGPKTPGDFRGGEKALGLDSNLFNQKDKLVENGGSGRFLPVLGFTNEDLRGMSVEDQQKAFREQITKEEWFKNHAEALVQEDVAVSKEQKEEEGNIRVLSVRHSDEDGLDVHVRYVSAKEAKELLNSGDVQVDMEDLNKKIEEQEKVIQELKVVDGSEKVIKQEEEELEDLEALKHESLDKSENKNQESVTDEDYKKFVDENFVSSDVLIAIASAIKNGERTLTPREQAILAGKGKQVEEILQEIKSKEGSDPGNLEESRYEERKDLLEKNGWSKEEYEALTKEDQDFVYWKGVKEEKYSRNKTPEENDKSSKEHKEETVSEFVDRIWATKNESGSIHLQGEDEDFYNKNSEEIKKEIAKRGALEAAGNESGAKDVSENSQDLPKDERRVGEIASRNLENISVSASVKERLSDLGIESLQSLYAMSPEFFSLLPDKQMYLLSKIEQKIYLDADLASKDQNEEEIKNMGFFKKIGASFTKDQRQVSLRDKAINKIIDGGLEDYKEDIATLGKYLMGAPKLKYRDTIKGRPVPNFEYVQVGNSRDQKIEEAKTFFNASASRFSEIPYEWSLETATNSQRKIYREALEDYTKEKNELSRAMLSAVEKEYQDRGKTNDEEIEIAGKYKEAQTQVMMMIRETDMHVNFGRYITQNPEMEKISSSFSEKILGTDMGNWAKGTALIGAGYATKWLGRTFAATGVGIVVAGAVGGYLADRKKRLEFEGKERTKRYGKSSEQILSLEAAIEEKVREIQKVRSEKGPQSATEEDKLTNEVSKLSKERRKLLVDSGIKENISSESVHERLGKLVSQFEKTTDEKSKARILETIKTRLFVTDEMMRDGRINFGKSKDQIVNQFKISDLMSKAAVLVEINGGFGVDTNTDGVFDKSKNEVSKEEQVFERFKQFIKDDQTQSEKDKARALAVLKGASVAMLGFSVGAGIRHAQEQGYFSAAWEAILDKSGDAVEKIKNLKGQITGVPYDYFKSGDTPITLKTPEVLGGEGLSRTPEDLTVKNIPSESSVLESAMAGSRGAIGAIDDLQDSLKLKFGNDVPAQYKDLMAKTPDQLAREWGFYKPGEANESAVIKKGEGFSIDSKGVVRFMGLNGEDVVYKPEVVTEVEAVESERKFFNAGNESSTAPENSYAKAPSRDFDYEKALRTKIDEGYNVVSKEIKPGPSNWYEKPVPTEFSKEPAPNVTSVSEGQDFVPNKEASPSKAVPVAESANVSGKSYEVSFGERGGKKFIPVSVESSWNLDDTPVARNEALGKIVNSKYHGALKFNPDFDRLAVAQEILDSKKYGVGSSEYEALREYIAGQKNKISAALRAEDVFETVAPSPGKASLGGVEYLTNSSTQVDLGSLLFKSDEVVNTYGEVTGSSKNLVSFKNGYIGIYEEAKDQGLINEKINKIRRDNAGKIGTLVYESGKKLQDGTIRILKIYKKQG